MNALRLGTLLLPLSLLGCSEQAPDAPDGTPAVEPEARPTAAVQPPPPADPPPSPAEFSFDSAVAADVTGDGVPDTLRLVASGTGPFNVPVSFTIRSEGRDFYRTSWESHEYFRYEPDLAMNANDSTLYAWVHDHLDAVLDSFAFGSLEAGATHAHPEGTADPDSDPVRLISGQLLMPFLLDSLLATGADSARARRTAVSLAYGSTRTHPQAASIWEAMTASELPTFTLYAGGERTERLAWSGVAERIFVVWGCCWHESARAPRCRAPASSVVR